MRLHAPSYWHRLKITLLAMILCVMSNDVSIANELPIACAPPEGSLSVFVISGPDWWKYSWTNKTLTEHVKEQAPIPIRIFKSGSSPKGKWNGQNTEVDQYLLGAASRLDTPYMLSLDGVWLASAVYTKIPKELPPLVSTHLALIQRSDPTLVQHLHFPHYIEALTWSPSSRFIAVLLGEPVSGPILRRFHDWLGAIAGHPSSYYTLRVSIYDLVGNLQCTQLIRKQVPIGGGYLEWYSETPALP